MENVVFTQLSIPEVRQILRQELENYFTTHKQEVSCQQESEEWVPTEEAAKILKLTVRTVLKYARNGEIPSSKRARKLYFSKKDLNAWLQEGSRATAETTDRKAEKHIQKTGRKRRNRDRV